MDQRWWSANILDNGNVHHITVILYRISNYKLLHKLHTALWYGRLPCVTSELLTLVLWHYRDPIWAQCSDVTQYQYIFAMWHLQPYCIQQTQCYCNTAWQELFISCLIDSFFMCLPGEVGFINLSNTEFYPLEVILHPWALKTTTVLLFWCSKLHKSFLVAILYRFDYNHTHSG